MARVTQQLNNCKNKIKHKSKEKIFTYKKNIINNNIKEHMKNLLMAYIKKN